MKCWTIREYNGVETVYSFGDNFEVMCAIAIAHAKNGFKVNLMYVDPNTLV